MHLFYFIADTFPPRIHYVKGTARGGQVFRLLAVFEDGKQESNAAVSTTTFKNVSNAGRYAQLLNENRQTIYVPLTSKGKFYELEDHNAHMCTLQKLNSLDGNANAAESLRSKQEFTECVHRIDRIVASDAELPITIRYIAAGQRNNTTTIPDQLIINKVTIENSVIACPIEEFDSRSPLHLRKLNITSEMRFIKCFLGFENEVKMFSNQNVQNILKYCQFNCDNFGKMIEIEQLPVVKHSTINGGKHKVEGLKILRPLNFPKLLRREKSVIAHEKEDSIIFLSKTDLENMGNSSEPTSGIVHEKMKVFQSTKKKWFRNLKPNSSAKDNLDTDSQSKRMSLDRYQDMSKLLQERFGGDIEIGGIRESVGRASSELGVDGRRATIDSSKLRQKSLSMQDMDSHSDFSAKPDVVNVDFIVHTYPRSNSGNSNSSDSANDESRSRSAIDSMPLVIDNPTRQTMDEKRECDEERRVISFSNQKSFITEKLCNEFHVKTKNYSKSSSNLQQFLHFQVPQKMNINETTKKSIARDSDHLDEPIKTFDLANMIPTTSIDDDLPYSSVRDSLIYQPSIDDDLLPSSSGNHNIQNHPENIYAEICTEGLVNNCGTGSTDSNGHRRSIIRISVCSTASNSYEAGPSSVHHSSIDRSSAVDNIYNTLK